MLVAARSKRTPAFLALLVFLVAAPGLVWAVRLSMSDDGDYFTDEGAYDDYEAYDDDDGRPTGEIVGGVIAEGSFAYTVGVARFRNTFCGGWLLNEFTVITAAHCVIAPFGLSIVVNRLNLSNEEEGQDIDVELIEMHPSFDPSSGAYDLAVLKLKDPAQIPVEYAAPIGDVTRDELQNGAELYVLGWGVTEENGRQSRELRRGSVSYLDYETCDNEFYGGEGEVTDQMVCATSIKGQDACFGDAGGPLVLHSLDGLDQVVGIVSTGGQECADLKKPGVYTAITPELKNWIREMASKWS